MKRHNRTIIKYFFSYLLIFTVTVISLFAVYRSELVSTLTEQFEYNALSRLNNAANEIDEEIKQLHTLNTYITGNVDIVLAKYSDTPSRSYNVRNELQKYTAGNSYILSAVYIDKVNGRMYSYNKKFYLSYSEGIVSIYSKQGQFSFDTNSYNDASIDRLVCLETDGQYCLVYYPVNHSYYNYISFFIIDNRMLTDVCETLTSESVSKCVITDGVHTFGSDDVILSQSSEKLEAAGVFEQKGYSALCVSDQFAGGLRVCALTSGEQLSKAIYAAWYHCLPMVFLIIVLGIILVFALTYFTYNPLRKLARKLKDDEVSHKDPLLALDLAMTRQKLRSSDLEDKIDYYRTLIKKSVLDSLISASLSSEDSAPNFDYLFEPGSNSCLAVAACPDADISEGMDLASDGIDCVTLARKNGCVFLLLSCHGEEYSDEEAFKEHITNVFKSRNVRFALSSESKSVLDIPKLYARAEKLFELIGDSTHSAVWTAQYEQDNPSDSFEYPTALIDEFDDSLRNCEFDAAQATLNHIFDILSAVPLKSEGIPDFYIHSILVDLLSVLTISMNDTKIPYSDYEDLFMETLYLCRSCPYEKEEAAIRSHFAALIRLYEKKTGAVSLSAKMIELIVEENIANPDFGITNLYDKYDISIAYMSYLFKKETGMGFSDYLWKRRFAKACELLKQGDKSIDEISIAVGYLHSSSFRRKFKQETGISPSDYYKPDRT